MLRASFPQLSRGQFLTLLGVGLLIRLACAPAAGTQDMEFWKAYATFASTHGITSIYGDSDEEIVRLALDGVPRSAIRDETQTIIHYASHNYFRKTFTCVQPPLYIYPLAVAGEIMKWVDPSAQNRRIFHTLINLPAIAASALITLILYLFVLRRSDCQSARLTAILYWLSPAVLLNSPVQGYMDPLVALFTTASVLALAMGRLEWSYVALACAVLTKPQGVLIAPVVLGVGLLRFTIRRNARAIGAAALTCILVFTPYLATGRSLSVIQGVTSIEKEEHYLSGQAMNGWWIAQYLLNGSIARAEGVPALDSWIGRFPEWTKDREAAVLSARLGFDVRAVGLFLLLAATLLNLWLLLRSGSLDPDRIIAASGLQVFGYFVFRVGVHVNHYFVLLPLFAAVALPGGTRLRRYLMLTGVFFLSDLLFYGLGRDFNPFATLLSEYGLAWTTVLLAAVVLVLYIWTWKTVHGNGEPAVAPARN